MRAGRDGAWAAPYTTQLVREPHPTVRLTDTVRGRDGLGGYSPNSAMGRSRAAAPPQSAGYTPAFTNRWNVDQGQSMGR